MKAIEDMVLPNLRSIRNDAGLQFGDPMINEETAKSFKFLTDKEKKKVSDAMIRLREGKSITLYKKVTYDIKTKEPLKKEIIDFKLRFTGETIKKTVEEYEIEEKRKL